MREKSTQVKCEESDETSCVRTTPSPLSPLSGNFTLATGQVAMVVYLPAIGPHPTVERKTSPSPSPYLAMGTKAWYKP